MKQLLSGVFNGLGEIWGHKLRSLLTICCVMLGVASMVLTTGFMEGFFRTWEESLQERGGVEKITAAPDSPPDRQAPFAAVSPGLRLEDARTLARQVDTVTVVAPEIESRRGALTRLGRRKQVSVVGATNSSLELNRYEIARGRTFSDLDLHHHANVMILGSEVVKELFQPGEEPLGAQLEHAGHVFTVIGVFRHYESLFDEFNALWWKNDVAYLPLTTMAAKITRSDRLTSLNFKAADLGRLRETVDAAGNLLVHGHRGIVDVQVRTNEEQLASFSKTKASFVIGGSAIAGVSLLVSGIGIMNLMLASINERVREIGIRKAIGATPFNIFSQFVAEAVTLSLVGGAAGVGAAIGLIQVLAAVMPPGNAPLLSPSAFVVGFGFSVAAGVLAGIYPAIQAAKLDPIEALRYE